MSTEPADANPIADLPRRRVFSEGVDDPAIS
jgi:hypothetical protein